MTYFKLVSVSPSDDLNLDTERLAIEKAAACANTIIATYFPNNRISEKAKREAQKIKADDSIGVAKKFIETLSNSVPVHNCIDTFLKDTPGLSEAIKSYIKSRIIATVASRLKVFEQPLAINVGPKNR